MKLEPRFSRRGQALIMVTMALLAMSGLIGMVVDFGWAYFERRTAQSAADAAAMAAVNAAMSAVRRTVNPITFASAVAGFAGQAESSCGPGSNGFLQNACQYATQNGFTEGGDNGRQHVYVSSDITPLTALGVTNLHCWVTVRITNTIPQLYSAVLGNANATIEARATAAIFDAVVNGAALGLNRQNDRGPNGQPDPVDLTLAAGSHITTDVSNGKGIILSSLNSGAGTSNSTNPTSAAFTLARGGLSPSTGYWPNAHTNQGDGPLYSDPMRDLGQPPLRTAPFLSTDFHPIPNGSDWSACNGNTCPPGVYFATDSNNHATGASLTISAPLNFSNGANFGDYVFYGGLNIGAAVGFAPGRYVFAGVSNPSNSTGPYTLNVASGGTINGGNGTDAGRLFILTRPDYPTLSQIAQLPTQYGTLPTLSFGQTNIGTGESGGIQLYGLNANRTLPTDANPQGFELQDFGPIVIWQDQRFSSVEYTDNGNVNTSCGSIDQPCTATASPDPKITFGLSNNSSLHGVVYQPRGAWMRVLRHAAACSSSSCAAINGAVQLISGAFAIEDNAFLNLIDSLGDNFNGMTPAPPPLKTRMAALVE